MSILYNTSGTTVPRTPSDRSLSSSENQRQILHTQRQSLSHLIIGDLCHFQLLLLSRGQLQIHSSQRLLSKTGLESFNGLWLNSWKYKYKCKWKWKCKYKYKYRLAPLYNFMTETMMTQDYSNPLVYWSVMGEMMTHFEVIPLVKLSYVTWW